MKQINSAILLIFLLAPALHADIHISATCSQPDVQAAVDAASDGDTVTVPPGVSTWTTRVYINQKAVTVQGAGGVQTKIHDATDNFSNNHPFDINGVEGKPWRISGFSFTSAGLNTWDDYNIMINVRGTCKNWRVDHCTFTDVTSALETAGGSNTYGVIDHCYFVVPTSSSVDYPMVPTMMHIFSDNATAWTRPLALGTSQALYIEDCVFNYGDNINVRQLDNANAMHASNGGRYVFRHNYVKNTKFEQFGACTNGGRGGVSGEVYDNIFVYDLNYPCIGGFEGGTGVCFNNTATIGGSFWIPLILYDYRPCSGYGCLSPLNSPCDGSSPLDGNLAADPPAFGAHTGSNNAAALTCSTKTWTTNQWANYFVWNITDGSKGRVVSNTATAITVTLSSGTENDWDTGDVFKITNGWPCYDQAGLGPNQTLEPVYEWNNTINGANAGFTVNSGGCSVSNYQTAYFRPGRDYYADTQKPGYVPYTYPHPLTVSNDTVPPTAPAVVRDGTGSTDADYTINGTQLSANWDAGTDADSGIAGYHYCIGTTPGASDVSPWAPAGNVLGVTKTGLALSIGTTYYFSVKAEDGAGLQSSTTTSNGQYGLGICCPPPPEPEPAPAVNPAVKAYPNPMRFTGSNTMKFRIPGASGGEVSIYTVSGKLVRKISSATGTAAWDCRNEAGETVKHGLYIYKITGSSGDTATGKIAVTR